MKTAIKIAWRFLTHAKGQSILIAIGIAVGVSVQVFIGSLISGLQAELVDTAIGRNTQITISSSERGGVVEDYQALVQTIEDAQLFGFLQDGDGQHARNRQDNRKQDKYLDHQAGNALAV